MHALQGLKQQYSEELARLTEASQAAAEALRQRLRRLTGERSLSSKATTTTAAPAGGGEGRGMPPASAEVPQSSTAAYIPASMPHSDSIQSSASTAGIAAPVTLPASLSATRLSDSWGSASSATASAQQADHTSISQLQNTTQSTPNAQFEGGNEVNPFSDARLAQTEQPVQQSKQSVPRTIPDSKPPKPASSLQPSNFTDQQPPGRGQSIGAASAQSGVLPNQMGRKTSLMSAGSGYQADSDSNSDTQVEPSTLSRLANSSSSTPHDTAQEFSGVPTPTGQQPKAELSTSAGEHASQLSSQADSETGDGSTQADSKAAESEKADKEPESPSLFGRATQLVGNTVWGAVHPIQAAEAVVELVTGHATEETTADKKPDTAVDGTEDAEAEDAASHEQAADSESRAQDSDVLPSGAASAAGQQTVRTESGYESDVDLPGNDNMVC